MDDIKQKVIDYVNETINGYTGHQDANTMYYCAFGVIDFAMRSGITNDDEDTELRSKLYKGVGIHITD